MTAIDTARVAAALTGYELGTELGRGGFGVVLAGRHRLIDRDVAVKVLLEPPDGDGDLRDRFLSEARVLAGLDHPHVVRIYDYVEHDGLCLLVMEQLTGGSLKNRPPGPLDPRTSCAVGLAATAALAAAHARGVLHRDIKPDNLLFTGDRIPKVTDFGIAKILETTAATTTGLVGTPRYMAPEQITGGRLSPGTDLYSLAIVLYELLAGRAPFPAGLTIPALLHHHMSVPPLPLSEVPPPLAEVLISALAKEPGWRPPTARDFALALASAATSVFGPGWLAASGVPVRLDDEVLAAAGHVQGTTPHPAALAGQLGVGGPGRPGGGPVPGLNPTRIDPNAGPGGPGGYSVPGGPGGHAGFPVAGQGGQPGPHQPSGPGDRPRRPTVLTASITAGAVLAAALGIGLWFTTRDSGPDQRPAFDGRAAEAASLEYASEIDIGPDGSLYVADPGSGSDAPGQVLRLTPDGTITRFAGTGPPAPTPSPSPADVPSGSSSTPSPSPTPSPTPTPTPTLGDGGPAERASLFGPNALAVGRDGTVYIADTADGRIRRVDDGRITTVAGAGEDGGFTGASGRATDAALSTPQAVAVAPNGDLYITDGYRIRKVTPDGLISVVAGNASRSATSSNDYDAAGNGGPATAALFAQPSGLAVGPDGELYIADSYAHTVRMIDREGKITLVAGTPGKYGYKGDGGLATDALLSSPEDIAVGPDGRLYIADTSNNVIRVVTPDHKIATFAGTDDAGADDEDGATATQTELSSPSGLAIDSTGAVYISEKTAGVVRRVGVDNIVTTVLREADE